MDKNVPILLKEITPSFKKNNVPVVFCADENYFPYLCVAINSLICNSSPNRNYDIFVIVDSVHESAKRKFIEFALDKRRNVNITFINIEPYLRGIDKSVFCVFGSFTISIYYRLFIPRILKNFDKAVYLDSDTVVLSDIAELYDENLENHMIGAVKDVGVILSLHRGNPHHQERLAYHTEKLKMKDPYNYFQSAVLLLNLKKMRKENFEAQWMEKLIAIKILDFPDQDLINSVCEASIKTLPMKWNLAATLPVLYPDLINLIPNELYKGYINGYCNPSIVHYCDYLKPWRDPSFPLAEHFWKYARQTPFYEQIIRQNILVDVAKNVKAAFDYRKNYVRYLKNWLFAKLSWGAKRNKYRQKKDIYKQNVEEFRRFLKVK